MAKVVTCIDETHYEMAFTKGKQYEVIEEKDGKLRMRGDNGRIRWYSSLSFDLEGKPVPILERWKFDNPSDIEANRATEVTMQFNDGQYRWIWIATPDTLKELLQDPNMEPGIWIPHMVIMRSFDPADVGMILSNLDRSGELVNASRPIDHNEDESDLYEIDPAPNWHIRNPRPERRYLVQKQSTARATQENHE